MTFMSFLAIALTLMLMFFGINLSSLTGQSAQPNNAPTAAPTATEAATEASTPEVTEIPATEAPTEAATQAPTMQPAATMANTIIVSEDQAISDTQTLATAMFTSVLNQGTYHAPLFIEDTAATHLAARWVDYKTAKLGGSLAAFKRPGIEPVRKSMYSEGDMLVYEIDCTVSMVDNGGADFVEPLTYTLKYGQNENGDPVVRALDISGDEDYDALKAGLPADADIAAIDSYVDAQIAALK